MNEEFRQFIAELGFEPPETVPGRLVRFSTNGKRSGKAGWAKLFADGLGGVCGDFRTGEKHTWQAKRKRFSSGAARRAWREAIEQRRRADALARHHRHEAAAIRAADIWALAAPAPNDHPYLLDKGVQPLGLRVHQSSLQLAGMDCEGALIIPARNTTGGLCTLEFIGRDGDKRFLPGGSKAGCYYAIGRPAGIICIAEGFATAASIYAATGYAVAVAFDAGNLKHVAVALRKKFPCTHFILCADNDTKEA